MNAPAVILPHMTLGKIALALSGGGYRASGFHLGTLEGLERLGLLGDVTILSTISGGTFTGAAYALARSQGRHFTEFRDSFSLDLQKLNVIERALGRLKESRDSAVNASLICAAARVYDDFLFKNAYFDELFKAGFEEIAFNATEFVYGLSFRFPVSTSGAVIGNKYFNVPRSAVGKIRIADIVAASSCFPGGFEPILFPHQFRFKGGAIPEELQDGDFEKPIPLMDGGIYDNQGISSALLALKRNPKAFDLLLISDTDQSGDEIYRDKGSVKNGILKVWHAIFLLKATFVISLISAGALVWSLSTSDWNGWQTVFAQIVPLVTMLVTASAIAYGWRRWREVRSGLDRRIADVVVRDLGRISVAELGVFARNRVLSVLQMALSVLLKRIRDLTRSEAQQLQEENPKVHDRDSEANSGDSDADQRGNHYVIETRIVKIPGQGKLAKFVPIVGWLTPTPGMLKVTELAKAMGTQLWFDSAKEGIPVTTMTALRLSGEITLCASVLQHLLRYRRDPASTVENPKFTRELDELYQKARQYWETDLTERARAFS
jgi:predicted acylesterase/phospholipase RssA